MKQVKEIRVTQQAKDETTEDKDIYYDIKVTYEDNTISPLYNVPKIHLTEFLNDLVIQNERD